MTQPLAAPAAAAAAVPMAGRQVHLLSVDVDDLLVANADFFGEPLSGHRSEIGRDIAASLARLEASGVKATFFVNAQYLERHSESISEIAARGHVLASHGYRHQDVRALSLAEFEADLRRSLELLRQLQPRVIGYRAPAFSLPFDAAHLRVLVDHGIEYVSSGVGVARSDAPRSNEPVEVHPGLVHVPISTAHLLGGRIKYAIGYCVMARLLPQRLYLRTLRSWLATRPYFHWYCHTFELAGLSPAFTVPFRRLPARISTTIYSSRCRGRSAYLGRILAAADFRSIEEALFAQVRSNGAPPHARAAAQHG